MSCRNRFLKAYAGDSHLCLSHNYCGWLFLGSRFVPGEYCCCFGFVMPVKESGTPMSEDIGLAPLVWGYVNGQSVGSCDLCNCGLKNTLSFLLYAQNNILTTTCMPVDKFMHFYESTLLPSHFNHYFKSIQSVHTYPTRLEILKFFLTRGKLFKGNAPSNLLDPRYG